MSKWHEEIRPRLDRVEKRGNFDIHRYGSTVLGHFPDDNRKTTVSFGAVVKNMEREEVCRYFLSTLMLANTYNVELGHDNTNAQSTAVPPPASPSISTSKSPKKGKNKLQRKNAPPTSVANWDSKLPMDDVELTLLSRRRPHEEMTEYEAPSNSSLVQQQQHEQQLENGVTSTSPPPAAVATASGKSASSRKRPLQKSKSHNSNRGGGGTRKRVLADLEEEDED